MRTWGEKPAFDFEPKAHDELGEALGILDMKRAAKIAGARFALYRGAGALLERALINFMLDLHTNEHGYTEWLPPFMVNPEAMTGTGQLPKFEEDLFRVNDGKYYLIPTAEVPVTNIHREEILNGEEPPLKYTAYTPCFRSEAGSYGQDTRGLIRQHQFNKVELVKFSRPETSYDELENLTTGCRENIETTRVALSRRPALRGGSGLFRRQDVRHRGLGALPKHLPGDLLLQQFRGFPGQTRRHPLPSGAGAKPEFIHTLNGSGLAVGRTLVAVLENCQRADGSVAIPEALRPYMGGTASIST